MVVVSGMMFDGVRPRRKSVRERDGKTLDTLITLDCCSCRVVCCCFILGAGWYVFIIGIGHGKCGASRRELGFCGVFFLRKVFCIIAALKMQC